MADGKREVVLWCYVGGSRSIVEIQNPGGVQGSFVMSAAAFDDLKKRNPNIIFRFQMSRKKSQA